MTLQEALNYGITELQKAHTRDPEGCAKFLLRHCVARTIDNQQLTINFDSLILTDPNFELPKSTVDSYRLMVRRRAKHEPAWYITNEAYFWKDTFFVDGRVLIPRPETELLVETVLTEIRRRMANGEWQMANKKMLGHSLVANRNSQLSIVDVGTGSGAIAISLARELRNFVTSSPRRLSIYATDISKDAIDVAEINAKRIGVAQKISFLVGDALEPLKESVDIIVGNPPYVPSGVVGGLAYDIHHFEPRVALDGGTDGLVIHRRILDQSRALLKKGGSIFMEIGHDQGRRISDMARKFYPKAEISIKKDYDQNDRLLVLYVL